MALMAVIALSSGRARAADDAKPERPAKDGPAGPSAAVTDEAFDAALAKAGDASTSDAEFRVALQSVASRFDEVAASAEPGKGRWTRVTLNERGKRVDAIRVRTPAGEPRDLVWAFTLPASVERWYICPVEGEMQGFRNFWLVKAPELFGPSGPALAPGDKGVVQTLDARRLKPDAEYLLWFVFKDDRPAPARVTVSFLPPGRSTTTAAASKGLGLPRAPEAADKKS